MEKSLKVSTGIIKICTTSLRASNLYFKFIKQGDFARDLDPAMPGIPASIYVDKINF